MSKTYVRDEALTESSYQLACALGLPQRSAAKAISRLQMRKISDREKVFRFIDSSPYKRSEVPTGLFSAEDIATATKLKIEHVKQYLSENPYGLSLPFGRYVCVLDRWVFQEEN
jgi:hypothetical protein